MGYVCACQQFVIYIDHDTLINSYFFFFNDTATTEIYTLSLHDALPIFPVRYAVSGSRISICASEKSPVFVNEDRKSTRLNSSHSQISYAVFCLKKKNHRDLELTDLPGRSSDTNSVRIFSSPHHIMYREL